MLRCYREIAQESYGSALLMAMLGRMVSRAPAVAIRADISHLPRLALPPFWRGTIDAADPLSRQCCYCRTCHT